ncbi:KUP/HAK/KT family potassium transporter [Companilactobacillus sp.]|jgi:KUP system potassium uptake protein|uniref:KUP/HAK/KT family potassium transporter n=1 Tax=Companilactobacillus sp. TaxID=2767905 RepID=UPI0025BECE4B|nr:KUP/HAK/KT family potassium transporter [Companilactobacillus sp.]MCH4010229.1 KUP/HAK/KT family potassium transporter [Companilactobacillus sp.]MCH4052095.1 KUP/HAK/KT family potassium transporter [Companilactobacillus sp.]MCH4078171.1 KUP/HAK/KT family potassium transporter [Companilactobacillus sp.]MCH4126747.1 KUP/HAK/KT family potassium transporter [Companilactobacillus sp.]MCH4132332.1 KUP/HAK/KT family potassium transporter [Companilactobacillus sp.]
MDKKDLAMLRKNPHAKMSAAGFLIALGIVYGDIGTSPLYVMNSLMVGNGGLSHMSTNFVLGSVSLIFWTLTIVTTTKYVLIALRADNRGEGGIFALYTLVRKRAKWLIIPAMIGGATFLADGMMTPAVTVTAAIEGLKGIAINNTVFIHTQTQVIIITIIILSTLFFIQRFGTQLIGKAFGPIMLVWFAFLGLLGIYNLSFDWSVLRAFNPYYAIELLRSPYNIRGIFILGSIFLATTGAEALYSDMGHVGRPNIYTSWPFVKICLLLSYLGQATWMLRVKDNASAFNLPATFNPFYESMPPKLRLFGIFLAAMAAIIASQALISGSYTLVSEATKLRIFPRLKTFYPTNFKGQLYIPTVNSIIWIICISLVIFFQNSENMSNAYGLEITITMLMTTILLHQWMLMKRVNRFFTTVIIGFFFVIESIFLITNSSKFIQGAYITMIIAAALIAIMFVWRYGDRLMDDNTFRSHFASLLAFKHQLNDLRKDPSYPLTTTNLVYLTKVHDGYRIKKNILYSILDKRPKRAEVYWFVTVNVTDEPYTAAYSAETFDTDYMVSVQLYLGFRVDQKVNVYLRQIVNDLMSNGEIKTQPQKYTTIPDRQVGDFSFVLIKEVLSPDTRISGVKKGIIHLRLLLQKFISPANWFGLSYSDVVEERVPLVLGKVSLNRIRLVRKDRSALKDIPVDNPVDDDEDEE